MSVKIASLELENVKRIHAVELEPAQDGLTVIGARQACSTPPHGRSVATR